METDSRNVSERKQRVAAWREGRENSRQKEQMAKASRCTEEGSGAGGSEEGGLVYGEAAGRSLMLLLRVLGSYGWF